MCLGKFSNSLLATILPGIKASNQTTRSESIGALKALVSKSHDAAAIEEMAKSVMQMFKGIQLELASN